MLVEASIDYLSVQVRGRRRRAADFRYAGPAACRRRSSRPGWWRRRGASSTAVRAQHPHVPIIGFPRGAGGKIERYVARDGRAGRGLRYRHGRWSTCARLPSRGESSCRAISIRCCWLPAEQALERQVDDLCSGLRGVPHIFNLGHGIVPETPPEHVARLVELVRGASWKRSSRELVRDPDRSAEHAWIPGTSSGMTACCCG